METPGEKLHEKGIKSPMIKVITVILPNEESLHTSATTSLKCSREEASQRAYKLGRAINLFLNEKHYLNVKNVLVRKHGRKKKN